LIVDDAQLQLFASTVFLGDPLPKDWPDSFVIVNAWAPTGQTLTAERNQAADEALRQALERVGLRHHRVIGASPDLAHQEPSWAVDMTKESADELADHFQQVAFFAVEQGRLFVVPTGRLDAAVALGDWSGRLR
jgi:hypothetical protein